MTDSAGYFCAYIVSHLEFTSQMLLACLLVCTHSRPFQLPGSVLHVGFTSQAPGKVSRDPQALVS
jgi:hypothetical protein